MSIYRNDIYRKNDVSMAVSGDEQLLRRQVLPQLDMVREEQKHQRTAIPTNAPLPRTLT